MSRQDKQDDSPVQDETGIRLRFSPNWKVTIFTLLLFPVLLKLGFWQLDRAKEKEQIAAELDRQMKAAPLSIDALDLTRPDSLNFRAIRLQGEYDPQRYLLLDNRVVNGRPGYDVLSLFRTDDQHTVLLNRGWIAGSPDRSRLPEVPQIQGTQTVVARIHIPQGKDFVLAEENYAAQWPLRVQSVNIAELGQLLENEEIFPYELRLQAGYPGSLTAHWKAVNQTAARHRGYAVQWFSMAAALALLYLWTNTNATEIVRQRRRQLASGAGPNDV